VASNSSKTMGWFVPPLVVPALLGALFLAWIAYQAHSWASVGSRAGDPGVVRPALPIGI